MKMRRAAIAALVVAILLAAPACIHFGRANAFQKSTSLSDFEQQMWEQVKGGKWLDVRAHMAETYMLTLPNGAHDREWAMTYLQSLKLDSFSIQELKTRPNGSDMVVTYDLELRGTAGGRPIPPQKIHVQTVWQSVKHGWIQIAQSMMPDANWPEAAGR